MCGIHCILSRRPDSCISAGAKARLTHRGPDSCEEHRVQLSDSQGTGSTYLAFTSSVLCLRGDHLAKQPLIDTGTSNVLCWNGEAWSINGMRIAGNDGESILQLLCEASAPSLPADESQRKINELISSIRGPFAMIFLDVHRKILYFLRDCLGRRSLLSSVASNGDLVLASVSDFCPSPIWSEVEADGLYAIDLSEQATRDLQGSWTKRHIAQKFKNDSNTFETLILPFSGLNKCLPSEAQLRSTKIRASVDDLQSRLSRSLDCRITRIRDPAVDGASAHIAVLFSGGLDCTILVRLAHELLPLDEPIDLINVAFENPRIHKDLSQSPYEKCPDRQTARSSLKELTNICTGRVLRLICVDVPYSETEAHRQSIIELMQPHNTEMDFSITCALYFASRGIGIDSETSSDCGTSARVLLSGLGADELFGGYQRHAIAYSRNGFQGLVDELGLDFSRLGKRNLGRDDRVLSHWGRETRFPYLDEDVVAWALEAPVWFKTGFGHTHADETSSDYDTSLEPDKLILRQMALNLGLPGVAAEKKRAIQFGSRTAKMQSGRTKGTTLLS